MPWEVDCTLPFHLLGWLGGEARQPGSRDTGSRGSSRESKQTGLCVAPSGREARPTAAACGPPAGGRVAGGRPGPRLDQPRARGAPASGWTGIWRHSWARPRLCRPPSLPGLVSLPNGAEWAMAAGSRGQRLPGQHLGHGLSWRGGPGSAAAQPPARLGGPGRVLALEGGVIFMGVLAGAGLGLRAGSWQARPAGRRLRGGLPGHFLCSPPTSTSSIKRANARASCPPRLRRPPSWPCRVCVWGAGGACLLLPSPHPRPPGPPAALAPRAAGEGPGGVMLVLGGTGRGGPRVAMAAPGPACSAPRPAPWRSPWPPFRVQETV